MMIHTDFDEKWVAEYCERTKQRNPIAGAQIPKQSKYRNKRTERDGIQFDSKREADRWSELQTLLRAGKVLGVIRQHPFRLPGDTVYIADFVVLNRDGTYTVEDAKGVRTDVYKLKKRQMKKCLGIEIVEA